MIKLELQQTDGVLTAINKIKSIGDLNIEITIPKESVLFENSLNLKLIQQQADKMEKSIEFITEDEIGNVLISSLTGKSVDYIPEEFEQELAENITKERRGLPKINFSKVRVPNFIKAQKGIFFFILILLTLLGSFLYYGYTAPKAKAVITVGSQPFARSITIKVKSEESTNVQEKILRGTVLSTTIEETLEKETTGTKIVGDEAEGEITIYNKTTSKIKLEKGDEVVYKGKSTDLNYVLKSDVDVPPRVDDLIDITKTVFGEETVKIIAENIGDAYNIDDGKSLEFSDYEKDDLVAKTKGKISGGKSEQIKIVAEEDRTNLSNELRTGNIQKAEDGIKNKLGLTQKLVEGSIETRVSSEKFSAEVDDEKDKISLTQTVTSEGLVYMESDLNNFIDDYFKDILPENFYMPDQDKDIKVDVLGKSTDSVLTSKEADIQVTLKAIIIPDIKEDDVRESLRGKTEDEARDIINNLKNVEQYEFNVSPAIPLFRKTPKDPERIEVILVKELKGESL